MVSTVPAFCRKGGRGRIRLELVPDLVGPGAFVFPGIAWRSHTGKFGKLKAVSQAVVEELSIRNECSWSFPASRTGR